MRRRKSVPLASGQRKTHFFAYPTYEAMIAAALAPSEMPEKDRSSRRIDSGSWTGASWEDAKQLAVSGDLAGASRLRPAILKGATAIVASQSRFDPVYKLDGGAWIDVSRYVKGEPECWGDMVEAAPLPRKGIAIIIDVACSSGTSTESIEKAGIAIGSAILGAQATGHSVTLYACDKIVSRHSNGESLIHVAPLNPGGSMLDISKLSAVLRTWFQRRIMFSLQETRSEEIRTRFGIYPGGGYGQVSTLTPAETKQITGLDNAAVLSVQQLSYNPAAVQEIVFGKLKGGN